MKLQLDGSAAVYRISSYQKGCIVVNEEVLTRSCVLMPNTLIRDWPPQGFEALERTHFLLLSNLPRLVTLPVAFWSAASGGGLATIVSIAVIGEALSLCVGLTALAVSGVGFIGRDDTRLAEGL